MTRFDRIPTRSDPPRSGLDVSCHELLEELEQVDDAVWGAIQGDSQAFVRLQRLWPQISRQLPHEIAEESREQYLRYAIQHWRRDLETGQPSPPQVALAALDVMSFLLQATTRGACGVVELPGSR